MTSIVIMSADMTPYNHFNAYNAVLDTPYPEILDTHECENENVGLAD